MLSFSTASVPRLHTLALVLLLLSSCALLTPSREAEPNVVKSESDSRGYRYLTLPNALRVLLVSDPATDRAAAALDVFAGSAQDPQQYQGLAHFLEHMLFLGTEKYPEPGEYQAFITANGGTHNAYTSFEHTNYFFEVEPLALDGALDRFAQFFAAPLFNEAYVEREVNAVNSEYMMGLKDDMRRGLDVIKDVVNPEHPLAKLSVGTLETLKDDGQGSLRTALLDFHRQHYSANRMALVVVGNQSLAELETMVRARFSAIANQDLASDTIAVPLFAPGQLPMRIDIAPVQQQRTLTLSFPIPSVTPHYEYKPTYFLGDILGHEGEGSLLSWLKQQGWADGLSAGDGLSYEGGASFNIRIALTENGVTKIDDVVLAVFQAIARIAQGRADYERLFAEEKALAQMHFRYRDKQSAVSYASDLAGNMHYYPAEQVLAGDYLLTSLNAPLIASFLDALNPDNALITLEAPGVTTDRESTFYHTPFRLSTPGEQQLMRWRQAGVNPAITLPAVNPFVPTDFSLQADTTAEAGSANADASPRLLIDTPPLQLWFRQDDDYHQPRGSLYVDFSSPLAAQNARGTAALNLAVALLADNLNEFAYPAMLAGLEYALTPEQFGMQMAIYGFNEKQPILLQRIVEVLATAPFDAQRFELVRQQQMRQLQNYPKAKPYLLLGEELRRALLARRYSPAALLAEYPTLTLAEVQDFYRQFLQSASARALVYGNYTEAQAREVATIVGGKLLAAAPPVRPPLEIAQLAPGDARLQTFNDHADAGLLLYLQADGIGKAQRAAMGLTAQILSAPFYHALRTNQQLGYVVSSGAMPLKDVAGMLFLVQSPVAGPAALQRAVEDFLAATDAQLAQMSEEQFLEHRAALQGRLRESPHNLREQGGRYWQDVIDAYPNFDSREQVAAALDTLDQAALLRFYREQITGAQRRALWLYSSGKFPAEAPAGKPVASAEALKHKATFRAFP